MEAELAPTAVADAAAADAAPEADDAAAAAAPKLGGGLKGKLGGKWSMAKATMAAVSSTAAMASGTKGGEEQAEQKKGLIERAFGDASTDPFGLGSNSETLAFEPVLMEMHMCRAIKPRHESSVSWNLWLTGWNKQRF